MKSVSYRCLALALVLMAADNVNAGIEDGRWYRYESANFEVYSRISEMLVAQRIRDLEAFTKVAESFVGVAATSPSRALTSSKVKAFFMPAGQHLRKLFDIELLQGLMISDLGENVLFISISGGGAVQGSNETAFHEYVHLVMNNGFGVRVPPWYSEGLAEVLSTIRFDNKGLMVGAIPQARGLTLLRQAPMPIRKLLEVANPMDMSDDAISAFYARSWLLAHYIQLSEASRHENLVQKMNLYLNEYNRRPMSPQEFFVFLGIPEAELEARLDAYKDAVPRFVLEDLHLKRDVEYSRERVSRARIAYELGHHVLRDNSQHARTLLTKARKLDAQDSRPLSDFAWLAAKDGDLQLAERLHREAVAGAGSHEPFIAYGAFMLAGCEDQCSAGQYDEAAQMFRKAARLAPQGSVVPAFHFADLLMKMGHPGEAVSVLESALVQQPASLKILYMLAIAHLRAGNLPVGKDYMERVLAWSFDRPEFYAAAWKTLRAMELDVQESDDGPQGAHVGEEAER